MRRRRRRRRRERKRKTRRFGGDGRQGRGSKIPSNGVEQEEQNAE